MVKPRGVSYSGRSWFVRSALIVRKRCGKLFHFSRCENLAYSNPSNHCDFVSACRCVSLEDVDNTKYSRQWVVQVRWAYAMRVCTV